MIDCGKCKHGEISLFYLIGVNSGQMSIECKINLETLPEKCIRYQKINWIKYVFRMLLPKRKFQEIKEMRRGDLCIHCGAPISCRSSCEYCGCSY